MGQESGLDIEALTNSPAFTQLRTIVQQNPALLAPFLVQLRQTNPALMGLIAENPEAFAGMLMGESTSPEQGEAVMEALEQGLGGEGGGAGAGGQGQYIEVTQAEQDAIERIAGMGFERQIAIQAFLACDRNEVRHISFLVDTVRRTRVLMYVDGQEIAVNFLLENGPGVFADDDDDMPPHSGP